MSDSQFLIAIIIAIVVTAVILLCFTSRKESKNDSYKKDLPNYPAFPYNNETCHHLEMLARTAGYYDEIFLENEMETHYNKKCEGYKKDTEGYPNYNTDVCKQVNILIDNTAVYDMSTEIDLHDYLEDYFEKNCKTDRYKK